MSTSTFRRSVLRATLASLIALSAVSALAGAAGAVTKTPLDVNLVKNPGADAGATGDGTAVVGIPGWTTTASFTAVAYGIAGYPVGVFGSMFACGPGSSAATASQVIPVTGRNAIVDAHGLKVMLSVHIAATGSDTATAVFAFRDAKGHVLVKDTVGPFTDTKLSFGGGGSGHVVPAHTRSIKVTLRGVRHDGAFCDAFFDNVVVTLAKV